MKARRPYYLIVVFFISLSFISAGTFIGLDENQKLVFLFGGNEIKLFLTSTGLALISALSVYYFLERWISRNAAFELQEKMREVLFEDDTLERFYPDKELPRIGKTILKRLFNDKLSSEGYWEILESIRQCGKKYRRGYHEKIELKTSPKPELEVKATIRYKTIIGLNDFYFICYLTEELDHAKEVLEGNAEFAWGLLLEDQNQALMPDHFIVEFVYIDNIKLEIPDPQLDTNSEVQTLIYHFILPEEIDPEQEVSIEFKLRTYQAGSYGFISIGIPHLAESPRIEFAYGGVAIGHPYVLPYTTGSKRAVVRLNPEQKITEVIYTGFVAKGGGVAFSWNNQI